MSATLRVSDFRENLQLFPKSLFSNVPNVISVEARQFPVTIHYNKATKEDYLEQAFKKIVKIHKNLPAGGILVFLTGKKEIQYVQKRLSMEMDKKVGKDSGDDDDESSGGEEMKDGEAKDTNKPDFFTILPLYSQLDPAKQYQIF